MKITRVRGRKRRKRKRSSTFTYAIFTLLFANVSKYKNLV